MLLCIVFADRIITTHSARLVIVVAPLITCDTITKQQIFITRYNMTVYLYTIMTNTTITYAGFMRILSRHEQI